MHQWNLDKGECGEFRIWNESVSLSVGDVVGDAATVNILDSDNDRIIVLLHKGLSKSLVASDDCSDRLRDTLTQIAEASEALYRNDMAILWYLRLKLYSRHAFKRTVAMLKKVSAKDAIRSQKQRS